MATKLSTLSRNDISGLVEGLDAVSGEFTNLLSRMMQDGHATIDVPWSQADWNAIDRVLKLGTQLNAVEVQKLRVDRVKVVAAAKKKTELGVKKVLKKKKSS